MHPPLDRPHPDCQDVIEALKVCHNDGFKKYYGGCNNIKIALDACLKHEKTRLLHEMNANLVQDMLREQDMIAQAFGKTQTFAEYLAQDKDYQNAVRAKQEKLKKQQQPQA
jgi:COX assembly mitochondrial protein 2